MVKERLGTSALDGQVSAEWIRCPGSTERHAEDSRNSRLDAREERLSAGVRRKHPVTFCNN